MAGFSSYRSVAPTRLPSSKAGKARRPSLTASCSGAPDWARRLLSRTAPKRLSSGGWSVPRCVGRAASEATTLPPAKWSFARKCRRSAGGRCRARRPAKPPAPAAASAPCWQCRRLQGALSARTTSGATPATWPLGGCTWRRPHAEEEELESASCARGICSVSAKCLRVERDGVGGARSCICVAQNCLRREDVVS